MGIGGVGRHRAGALTPSVDRLRIKGGAEWMVEAGRSRVKLGEGWDQ